MLITEKLPEYVSWQKVSEFAVKNGSGVHLVTGFFVIQTKVNTLLFYCFCYNRTNKFTSKRWKEDWDAAHLGEHYAESKDGIRDALLEFQKYEDTSMLDEEEEKNLLAKYAEICDFCKGVIYHPVPEPDPIPPPPPPKPDPIPEPEPQPEDPNPEPKPTNWKGIMKIAAPILIAILGAASLVLPIPGWLKLLVETILKSFGG